MSAGIVAASVRNTRARSSAEEKNRTVADRRARRPVAARPDRDATSANGPAAPRRPVLPSAPGLEQPGVPQKMNRVPQAKLRD